MHRFLPFAEDSQAHPALELKNGLPCRVLRGNKAHHCAQNHYLQVSHPTLPGLCQKDSGDCLTQLLLATVVSSVLR